MNFESARHDSPILPDTVFVRTAHGNAAARAVQADLPRMVKTLLIAVDGRTSVAMFQKLLPNFGDVSALFDALEAGGYIERAGGVSVKVPAPAPPPGFAPSPPRAALRVVPPAAPEPTPDSRQPLNSRIDLDTSRWFESTQVFAGPASRQPEAAPPERSSFTAPNLSGHRSMVTEIARVRETRTLMSDFLFAHMPEVAMEAVLALERLETTEQILRNIPEYQRLIAATGRKGVEHLAAVRTVLSS
jgi:hypothetical protein